MLLASSIGARTLSKQPNRSQLRFLFLVAAAILVAIFFWTTNGTDGQFTSVMTSWPGAMASAFSDGVGGYAESSVEKTPDSPKGTTEGTKGVDGIPSDRLELDGAESTKPDGLDSIKTSDDTTPPMFILVGDSTTNGQIRAGGGWGDSFLWLLTRGAEGINHGVNGAVSKGYFHSPMWETVLTEVKQNVRQRKTYVTIQFGHNDQNPATNVTLDLYQETIAGMAREVVAAGGTPVLVTPLARRDFDIDGVTVVDNLGEHREATKRAHAAVLGGQADTAPNRARLIDLNAASMAYIGAIGRKAAFRYNKYHEFLTDTTHLNEHGALIFSRVVADLLLGHPPQLVPSGVTDPWAPGRGNDDDGLSNWIEPNPYLTGLIWHGDPA